MPTSTPITLFDLFTQADFEQQIADRMIAVRLHPDAQTNLAIVNYTQTAQFTPEKWNHVTDLCRGLIYNTSTFEIVARPFKKFWNLNDARHPETLIENLPAFTPLLTRKMDGSLGILYHVDGACRIATRGSFTSEQAAWASHWLASHYLVMHHAYDWPHGYTPLFEIVYPENRIVVQYDYSGLVLLAMVHINTGQEMPYDDLVYWARYNELRVVERFNGKTLSQCLDEDMPNEEGFVAAWPCSHSGPPLRVKIKYETYCRLHRLLTQTTPWRIWEMCKLGKTEDLATAPDSFRLWATREIARFDTQYASILDHAHALMHKSGWVPGDAKLMSKEQRGEFAKYALAQGQPYTAALFAMLDGKDPSSIIWKSIEPRGDEKSPFTVGEE